jgi:dTDP-glucose pyrophosphorylase/predicted transcriptional regulator
VLLTPQSSIREALEIINREALRIALVVNENHELLGVITDGDIRRGILNNIELAEKVTLIMNDSPKFAYSNLSRVQMLNIMTENSILSLPVIDYTSGKVIGLERLEKNIKRNTYENPVFIMAGGFGTRLKPLTDSCPKPMLKVGDKPILEILLNQFANSGFRNIYISTHYMPEQITEYFGDGNRWGVSITYIHENVPLGTGGALGLLPNNTPELPLIMINGDVLTSVDFERLLNFHTKYKPSATMCVREYDYQIPYGVITGDGHRIISMEEKPTQRFFVNAGIYVISPELFKNVEVNTKIDMPTLLEKEITNNKDVIMFPVHEYWLDIGRMDDYQKAQIDIQRLM